LRDLVLEVPVPRTLGFGGTFIIVCNNDAETYNNQNKGLSAEENGSQKPSEFCVSRVERGCKIVWGKHARHTKIQNKRVTSWDLQKYLVRVSNNFLVWPKMPSIHLFRDLNGVTKGFPRWLKFQFFLGHTILANSFATSKGSKDSKEGQFHFPK